MKTVHISVFFLFLFLVKTSIFYLECIDFQAFYLEKKIKMPAGFLPSMLSLKTDTSHHDGCFANLFILLFLFLFLKNIDVPVVQGGTMDTPNILLVPLCIEVCIPRLV